MRRAPLPGLLLVTTAALAAGDPPATQPAAPSGAAAPPATQPATPPAAAPTTQPAGSVVDARAVAIAQETMKAMGGRDAWEATRYLSWWFFGVRLHVWDRATDDVRIEGVERQSGKQWTILMNLRSGEGRVLLDGFEQTNPHVRADWLERGRRMWINDSYWLLMPWKLLDPGVTLRHLGEGTTGQGAASDVLELTFTGVGVTPENKYHVHVGKESRLVEQWSFFAKAADEQPRFTAPWTGWTRHGAILLSGGRGPERELGDIRVFERLPRSVFTEFEAIRLPEELPPG